MRARRGTLLRERAARLSADGPTASGADSPGIRLRGHHLLCLLSFSGDGYSPEFVERFRSLADSYREPGLVVRVLASPDDACAACPHLDAGGCASPMDGPEADVAALDAAVLDALGIAPGPHLAHDLHRLVAALSEGTLHRLCRACSWYGRTDCQRTVREAAARLTVPRTG